LILKIKNTLFTYFNELLNSYAILFFSNSKLFGALLLVVTFFKPFAGLSGLAAVTLAIIISKINGIANDKGLYSFNALMIGIGMGTFYNVGIAFWVLLFIAVLFSVIISGVLGNLLGKYGLPFLAIPFILCFWLILLVTKEFSAINLTSRNIYWLNEMYAVGDKSLINFILYFDNLPLHPLVLTLFKSLSSLFFQNNVLAGIIIFIGLFIHSRIGASLVVIGFVTCIIFNGIVHAYNAGINTYLIGGNFIMVTVAIGSFFVVPSIYSYLWAIACVPITFIITIGLSKITNVFLLPVYTWPFCFVTIVMIYFFSIKIKKGKLVLTPTQFYSPEKNLYNYLSAKERHFFDYYYQLQLPFLGQWIVSQGYDGDITHKGDWSKALDFVIVDKELKTYTGLALKLENFYCYNKPVLAASYGYVYEIVDEVEDNEIGKINQIQNWGNTIIIKHAEGLFTKMSHLKKNSFKVKIGDYVRQGDIVALCGNSGRSPEPHLHFQVQSTPYIGSKTMPYPFAYYEKDIHNKTDLMEYKVPQETELVSNIVLNESMSKAFEFLPGYRMNISTEGSEDTTWEVFTDAYNSNYLYCYQSKSIAYFVRLNNLFYFVSFYGDQNSLLYYFYLGCYKICLSTNTLVVTKDKFPLQLSNGNPGKWLQDIVAPFYIFRRLLFESENKTKSTSVFQETITIHSRQIIQYFSFKKTKVEAELIIENNQIKSFTIVTSSKKIEATCIVKG
jgi:urea transporter/murein DD-endopeptidase MepM/ murein hydrolase activator NlpD